MTALVRSAVAKAIPGGEWDPYIILGISPRATPSNIRAAYRQLAKEFHSDAGGDTAAFLLLKEAHDFLMDPAARALWDQKKIRATEQLRKRAIDGLTKIFDAVVVQIVDSDLSPEHQDIPAMVKKTIRATISELSMRESEFGLKLKRLRLMEGKTKRKAGADNIVTLVLAKRAGEVEQLLLTIKEELTLCEVMLGELDAYSSEAPPRPPVQEPFAAQFSDGVTFFFRGI